jgi:hypothetical protein
MLYSISSFLIGITPCWNPFDAIIMESIKTYPHFLLQAIKKTRPSLLTLTLAWCHPIFKPYIFKSVKLNLLVGPCF